jgi:hypothetical protein
VSISVAIGTIILAIAVGIAGVAFASVARVTFTVVAAAVADIIICNLLVRLLDCTWSVCS